MKFFSKSPTSNSSYVTSQGLSVTLSTKNGKAMYYGPGSIIKGIVNLDLLKPLQSACQLKVIFSCHQSIMPDTQPCNPQKDDMTSSIFEVEHVLVDNQVLPQCKRQKGFHFTIKLPLCSYPPSIEDGTNTIKYTLHALLSFQNIPGNAVSHTSVSSLPVKILYLPIVPIVFPNNGTVQAPSTLAMSPTRMLNTPVFETSNRVIMDPSTVSNAPVAIDVSIKCKTGVCIGEFVTVHLNIDNQSHTDLQSIHLALVRQLSYAIDRNGSTYTYSTPVPTTIHNATIPIAKVTNSGSAWNQQLQFKMPSNLGLIPSIGLSVTPLLKVDYFIMISIPIPQRFHGFVDLLKPGKRKRSYHDLSVLNNPLSSSSPSSSSPSSSPSSTPRNHSDQNLLSKNSTIVQLNPIPIVLGTIPSYSHHMKFRRPIPNYLEVTDRPKFVRDRFEEEMIKQISSLESLIVDEDDDDDIEELILEAQRNSSSEESEYENEKSSSRVPDRFRSYGRRTMSTDNTLSVTNTGLGTPPPSPPQNPASVVEDILSVQALSDPPPSFARHIYDAREDDRTHSHRSGGLARNLLLAMHNNNRMQQP